MMEWNISTFKQHRLIAKLSYKCFQIISNML